MKDSISKQLLYAILAELFPCVKGLWGGMVAGTGLQTLLLLLMLYRTNWNHEVSANGF